jgi:hypothetical protein
MTVSNKKQLLPGSYRVTCWSWSVTVIDCLDEDMKLDKFKKDGILKCQHRSPRHAFILTQKSDKLVETRHSHLALTPRL